MLKKGISPLIATVLVILLAFLAISVVLLIGIPAIERAREAAVINEAMQNMKAIGNTIKEVASEGLGSLRSLQMKVTDGEYKVNEKGNSVDFTYSIKSGIIQPGTSIKEDSVTLSCGANAKASIYDLDGDGSNDLVLENEILRIGILKNGTVLNQVDINTSSLIRLMNFKETDTNTTPSDSSIILDDYAESASGTGYSELVREEDHLVKAEAIVHMNTSFVVYDILYTLQSGADFIIVKIQNAYYK